MLQTFDKNVPLSEQRIRVAKAKQKGWKHKSKRRSWKVKEQQRNRVKHLKMLAKRFHKKVRAYWSGESDQHP